MDPIPPAHREYHPPTYNPHTQMDPPTPAPYSQPTGTNTHQLTTHTQMDPPILTPYPNPQGVPPTNLQLSHTNGPPYSNPQGLMPTNLQLSHTNGLLPPPPYPQHTGNTTHQLSICILSVLTQTILIRYQFHTVTTFISKEKNDIFDQIR